MNNDLELANYRTQFFMRNQLFTILIMLTVSCNFKNQSQSMKICFRISSYPEFKMGEIVEINRIPFNLMPYDTHDEEFKEILSHSKAYLGFGFDGGLSSLLFSIDNTDRKLNSITAMWTITGDPEIFMNRLKESYLPCIPIETLLKHPDTPIEERGHENDEFYRYSTDFSDGTSSLHYWVGIKY